MEKTLAESYKIRGDIACDNFNKNYMKVLNRLRLKEDPCNRNFNNKLTQKEVATMLGVHPQNYNKAEIGKHNGGNNITIEHLIRLSIIYGCPSDHILCMDHQPLVEKMAPFEDEKLKLCEEKNKYLHEMLMAQRKINAMLEEENRRLKKSLNST